jgi:hypothetical protein
MPIIMRRSWFDKAVRESESSRPERGPFTGTIDRVESWKRAIADGVIEIHEVAEQKDRLIKLLRELEPMLDDLQHEKVTRVLEEWTVLQAMHGTLLVDELGKGSGLDSFQAAVPPDEGPVESDRWK